MREPSYTATTLTRVMSTPRTDARRYVKVVTPPAAKNSAAVHWSLVEEWIESLGMTTTVQPGVRKNYR